MSAHRGGAGPGGRGRDLLGPGESLAVARFRARLLGPLDMEAGRGRWALDVGCGDGLEALELLRRGWYVDAVDLEPHPRWRTLAARYGSRLRFRVVAGGGLRGLRGLRKAYALVFQKDVLHHVPDPVDFLKSLAGRTAPGGELWLLECNRRNPISFLHLTLLKGHRHFTASGLGRLVAEAGLTGVSAWTREARVWPVESEAFQDAIDRFQDGLETLPFWRVVAVYHLMRWRRPAKNVFRSGQ